MIFLANENIPLRSIKVLREKGFDVKSISECFPGVSDKEVLILAKKEQRIVLTFDKDYRYLLYKEGIVFNDGLVYFKFTPKNSIETGELLAKLVSAGISFKGYYTVVSSNSIRQKPLFK